jgi:large subunit ribosomal protein L25
MADHDQLTARRRTGRGNGPTRRLRREGLVPGVLYQKGEPGISLAFGARELRRVISSSGYTGVVDVEIDGEAVRPAVLRDIQVEPTRDDVLHVDFLQVDLKVAIQAAVPLHLTGTPVGVREDGGIIDQPIYEVDVSALPDAIPESLEHDVSEMGIGDTLFVSDLTAPSGVEIVSDPELALASVSVPSAEPEPEPEVEVEGEVGEETAETGEGDDEG